MRPLDSLLGSLRGCLDQFPDKRRGQNTTYDIADIGMAAFSVFFMQSPSFLAHQRQFEAGLGRSNCTSLFGMAKIPSDNHIRDMLDPADPALLHPAFGQAVDHLAQCNGGLDSFRRLGGRVLIALDGTEYHCSRKIHCPHCSTRLIGKTDKRAKGLPQAKAGGETEYFHTMLSATLVAPGTTRLSRWSRNSSSPRTARTSRIAEKWPPSDGWPRMAGAMPISARCSSATTCSPVSRSARQ
jgi:hypothetical protein